MLLPAPNTYNLMVNHHSGGQLSHFKYFRKLPTWPSSSFVFVYISNGGKNPGCSLARFTCFESCDQMQASDWLSVIAIASTGGPGNEQCIENMKVNKHGWWFFFFIKQFNGFLIG